LFFTTFERLTLMSLLRRATGKAKRKPIRARREYKRVGLSSPCAP
jgi:hypothetical protein